MRGKMLPLTILWKRVSDRCAELGNYPPNSPREDKLLYLLNDLLDVLEQLHPELRGREDAPTPNAD